NGAFQLNFSTQQSCQFTADGKPQSGAAIFALRRTIRLLESFKHHSDFILRNPDSGIYHFEMYFLLFFITGNMERNTSVCGKLYRIRQEVFQKLFYTEFIFMNYRLRFSLCFVLYV